MALLRVTAADIARRALRSVGSFPATMPSPDVASLAVTIEALDEVCAHLGGKTELPWLKRDYLIDLLADTEAYDLAELTKASSGCDPSIIEHWSGAWALTIATGSRDSVAVWHEPDWRCRQPDRAPGRVEAIWVEKKLRPILHITPTPDADGLYRLELVGQQESIDLTAKNGEVQIEMPRSWIRTLALLTAVEIGAGRITRMPSDRYARLERRAATAEIELLGYSRPEHQGVRIAEAWGLD